MDEQEKIKVVTYIRESTDEQGYHGYRPDAQKDHIKAYCEKHNLEIVQSFSDWGSGSGTDDRPNFLKMVQFVKDSGDIRFIVLKEADRFYRNLREALNLEDDLSKNHNAFVIDTITDRYPHEYLEGGIPDDLWERRINERTAAEKELRTIKRRVTEGYENKAKRNQYVGPLCFGLIWLDKENEYVGWDDTESKIVQEIFALYATGRYGYTNLAKHFNELGYKRVETKKVKTTRKDGTVTDKRVQTAQLFTNDMIRSILSNKTYIGRQNTGSYARLMSLDEKGDDALLTPLIDEELFNKAQQQVQGNMRGKPGYKGKETSRQKRVYLLQGMLRDLKCGDLMHGTADTSGTSDVRRYICKGRKKGICSSRSVLAKQLELQVISTIKEIKIKNADKIEMELRKIIKINAKSVSSARDTNNQSKLRSQLEVLTAIQKENYDWQTQDMVEKLKTSLETQAGKKANAKATDVKYYDFIELRDIIADICGSLMRLQSLIAQKNLVSILIDNISIDPNFNTSPSQITVMHSMLMSLDGGGGQAPFKKNTYSEMEIREAYELKTRLQRFIPLLIQEIAVSSSPDSQPVFEAVPTGLYLLLNDDNDELSEKYISMYNQAGRKGLESLPAHQFYILQKTCVIYFCVIYSLLSYVINLSMTDLVPVRDPIDDPDDLDLPVDGSSLSDCANRITAGLRAIGVNPDEILPKLQCPSPEILSELLVIRSELKELAQQRATDDNDGFTI